MIYRTFLCFWRCALWCAVCGVSVGQESSTHSDAPSKTLEELKAEGALRSNYLQPRSSAETAEIPQANLEAFRLGVQPILEQACLDCHGPDSQEGNLRIDTLDPDLLHGDDVTWWLELLAVLNNGEMPPPDDAELNDQDRTQVVEWLSREVQLASTVRRANGGHSSFRRMTRYETNYALQDILGLPWEFVKDLPPEANSEDGFQNSSEMLHMSVKQFETYRQLARQALERATVRIPSAAGAGERPSAVHWGIRMQAAAAREWRKQATELEQVTEKFKDDPAQLKEQVEQLQADFHQPHNKPYYLELSTGRTALAQWAYNGAKYAFEPSGKPQELPTEFDHVAVIPSGRNQALTVELGDQIPDEGIMRVRVRAYRADQQHPAIPSLQLEFGWRASNEGRANMRVSADDTPIAATAANPQIYQWDIPLGDIYPRNSVRHASKMGDMPSPSEYIRLVNSSASQGEIHVDYVEVTAPVYDQWPPQSHQRIFFDSAHRADEAVYAREVLSAFMSSAWRRRITQSDIEQKMQLFQAMRPVCESFEQAMVEVLATVLASPQFLYIGLEGLPASSQTAASADSAHHARLTDYELATRLSMFLWCSVPDSELLALADDGQLAEARVLAEQVQRMLDDPRAERFAKHFVHQWLDMQLLDFLDIEQNSRQVDPLLKEAMQHEPIALFQEMLARNESVLNFIHADYTMANERLAKHYGLSDVYGNHFRRVPLAASQRRGGLLTQAGLLAMNSDGTDSHPLKRGVWLLESLLNDPPPPPPPAVPEIDLADPEIAKLTLKQRIEDHRNHAACMSCHAKIDPWGIAFENYDALGRWRDEINGQPVDASSLLFNKQELNGMEGLKRFLLEHRQDQFVRAMVHKLTTYALGRPLAFSDHSSIDHITAEVRRQGDGLATMIRRVVTSDLFQSK